MGQIYVVIPCRASGLCPLTCTVWVALSQPRAPARHCSRGHWGMRAPDCDTMSILRIFFSRHERTEGMTFWCGHAANVSSELFGFWACVTQDSLAAKDGSPQSRVLTGNTLSSLNGYLSQLDLDTLFLAWCKTTVKYAHMKAFYRHQDGRQTQEAISSLQTLPCSVYIFFSLTSCVEKPVPLLLFFLTLRPVWSGLRRPPTAVCSAVVCHHLQLLCLIPSVAVVVVVLNQLRHTECVPRFRQALLHWRWFIHVCQAAPVLFYLLHYQVSKSRERHTVCCNLHLLWHFIAMRYLSLTWCGWALMTGWVRRPRPKRLALLYTSPPHQQPITTS